MKGSLLDKSKHDFAGGLNGLAEFFAQIRRTRESEQNSEKETIGGQRLEGEN